MFRRIQNLIAKINLNLINLKILAKETAASWSFLIQLIKFNLFPRFKILAKETAARWSFLIQLI